VLPVVHDFTDYGVGVRRNFNEIQSGLLSGFQCFVQGDYPYLFTVGANEANFGRLDLIIDAGLFGPSLALSFNSYRLR